MSPKISIIVPVYNAEKTLKRCVDSILAQSFKDFELILVDDGSRDTSPNLCDDLAMLDARIVVVHQSNGGPNSARNKGVELASGEFITFLDSDDEFYTPTTIEENMRFFDGDEDLDIVSFPQYIEYIDECGRFYIRKKDTQFTPVRLTDKREMYINWYNGKMIDGGFGGKIFRKGIFDGWKFEEKIRFTEDIYTTPDICERTRAAQVSAVGGYLYRYNAESAIHTEYDSFKRYGEMMTQVKVFRYLSRFKDVEVHKNKFYFEALNNAYYLWNTSFWEDAYNEVSTLPKGRILSAPSMFLKLLSATITIFGYRRGIAIMHGLVNLIKK